MSTGILPSELRDSYNHLLYSVLGCTDESPIVLALRRAGFEGDPFSLVYLQDNDLRDLRYERVVDDDNRSDDGPDSVSGAPTIILEEVPLFERNLVGLLRDYVEWRDFSGQEELPEVGDDFFSITRDDFNRLRIQALKSRSQTSRQGSNFPFLSTRSPPIPKGAYS